MELQEGVYPPRQNRRIELQTSEGSWISRFKNRAQQLFQKEHKRDEPEIDIDIFYAPHLTPEDDKELVARFDRADIFIPENIRWTQEAFKILNDVSYGKRSVEDAGMKFYDQRGLALLELFANSHKPIIFIDLPSNHPLLQERDDRDSSSLVSVLGPLNSNDSFTSLIDREKSLIVEQDTFQEKREEYMLAQLPKAVQRTVRENPSLRAKKKLQVLLQLGPVHTPIFHALRRTGQEVTRYFTSSPFIYNFHAEAVRRHRFNREVDDTLVARVWLENFTGGMFISGDFDLTQNTTKSVQFQRKLIDQFSFEEIEDIFNKLSPITRESASTGIQREKVNERIHEVQAIFRERLREKGVQLPQSEVELDEFLASKELPKP